MRVFKHTAQVCANRDPFHDLYFPSVYNCVRLNLTALELE
jgi:hypothetical protein